MRVIIQRVSEASVKINGLIKSKINKGLLILVGFESEDNLYLLDDESISKSKEEENRIYQEDSFRGVMEGFLAPLNFKREVLTWTVKNYKKVKI